MPGFNGTGPMGAGSMTGGGRGMCNPTTIESVPQSSKNFGFGRGLRNRFGQGIKCGSGWGRCWNNFTYSGINPENAGSYINILKTQANSVKNTLDTINNKISEIEKNF